MRARIIRVEFVMILQKNLKFRVIHKSNQGVSNARNLGLEIAKGEYIMFLDSDDYLEKGIVKNLLDEAIQKNADIVGGRHGST
mgnify:CR=1 FL=1